MIRVTCAIIRNEDEQVLVVQRGENTDHPLKWEFPGGKIDDGETDEECIIREIREELSMEIVICEKLDAVIHDYGKKKITLIPFVCDTLDEIPVLNEHVSFRWVATGDLNGVDFSEADITVADNYACKYKTSVSSVPDTPESSGQDVPDDELRAMIVETMGSKHVEWLADSAVGNPVLFRKLLDLSYSDDRKLAFHSSWVLTKACDKYPELIYPFLPGIVEKINMITNESAQRSFLRILSLGPVDVLTGKHQGILADHCFSALRSGDSAIAIKAYSMEILYRLALIYPELANELSASIAMIEDDASAGIKARGKAILKKLAGEDPKSSAN